MIKYILLTIAAALTLSACHSDSPSVPSTAPMTVVVYMAADNSLGRDRKDIDDINEMIAAKRSGALSDGSRVMVYRAEYRTGRQRLLELKSDSLHTVREYDRTLASTDPERMRQVLADARTLAPAVEYGLVLWSHALGWTNSTVDPAPYSVAPRSFGDDLSANRKMTVSELGAALDPAAWKYIYFDCCLMASVEVAYELRHATGLIYASVTETPYDGCPYDKALALLADGSEQALCAIARAVASHYGLSTRGCCPVSASVISTAGLDRLADVTARIYRSGHKLPDDFEPQQYYHSYRYPSYRYNDLEQYVEAVCSEDALLDEWREALAATVRHQLHSDWIWSNIEIIRHCGLSTRIVRTPGQISTLGYDGLQWWTDVASHLDI
ncbi:MAG: hypothetical protein K2K99_06355 [Muribaculaceae bacterium]|nr:hypothetical protein [Muribaculaceae bacterium]